MDLSIINQFKENFFATIDRMSLSLTPQQKTVAIFAVPIFLLLATLSAVGVKVYKRKQEIKALETKAIEAGLPPDIVKRVRKSSQSELLQLIAQNGNLFYFASSALKSNKAFIKAVTRINASAVHFIAPKLKQDEAFMLELIAIDLHAVQHVPQEWRDNKDFMSKVLYQIKEDSYLIPHPLCFASKKVQKELNHIMYSWQRNKNRSS